MELVWTTSASAYSLKSRNVSKTACWNNHTFAVGNRRLIHHRFFLVQRQVVVRVVTVDLHTQPTDIAVFSYHFRQHKCNCNHVVSSLIQ